MDIQKVLTEYKNNGFEASYFETKEEAAAYLDDKIDNMTVSYGGSVTISEMGLLEKIEKHNSIFSHWRIPEGFSKEEILDKAMKTDIYLTSANGAGEDGTLVNIDGTGNRVSSTLFGHKKVYYVVGINKFAPTVEEAIHRARNVSAPLNAKRLRRDTPCAKLADRCYNCNSPERICRGLVVHYKKMTSCDMEVVIVGESLGF